MADQPRSASIRGRGAATNPGNRFESVHYAPDPDPQLPPADPLDPAIAPLPQTQYIPDATRSFIAYNNSPDVPFRASINPYRGCTHGCIYCFARPHHEYLGYSCGLDFETRILVKHDGPALLRKELADPKWEPQTVAISGVTDCYQPAEREFRITRGCLEVFLEFRSPVTIVTKNHLVVRDLDLLGPLAALDGVRIFVSITTLDADLTRLMEPRAAVPRDRLRTIGELSAAGIPVGVMVAPVIPGLTDHEMPAILRAAREAGALSAAFVPLRLPYGVKDLFCDWLERHMPDRKNKIIQRLREIRGGSLNDRNPCTRMRGQGVYAGQLARVFEVYTARLGMNQRQYELTTSHFRRPTPPGETLGLFES